MMNNLALALALVSLVLAAVAYWRSGGKQDIQLARREIEREMELLHAKVKELIEEAVQALAAGYEASRVRLRIAGERLRQLKDQAVEGLEKQVARAQEQLALLAKQLEEAARSAVEATAAAAREVERAVAIRVHHLEARVDLLYAKAKVTRSIALASKHEFLQAEQQLEEAGELLRSVRQILGDDHAYDELLDAMRGALREATTAVRTRAEVLRSKLELVLTEADRLVHRLESDEEQAAKRGRGVSSANRVSEPNGDQENCCRSENRKVAVS